MLKKLIPKKGVRVRPASRKKKFVQEIQAGQGVSRNYADEFLLKTYGLTPEKRQFLYGFSGALSWWRAEILLRVGFSEFSYSRKRREKPYSKTIVFRYSKIESGKPHGC